jgi:coniferyl-aldehyde dehydrogenase
MTMQQQFEKQRQAYSDNPYPSIEDRISLLKHLKSLLQTYAKDIAQVIQKDFGHRSIDETYLLEVFPSVQSINHNIKHVKKWAKKRRRKIELLFLPASAYLKPQPLGVVGIIVPWNYPLYLAISPLACAIAAGNRVMIKMSEQSPHLGQFLKKLFADAGIGEEKICIINGDVEIAKQFNQLPLNHLLFTGSTRVGKMVMQTASKNLTPVTLELGGKSPTILSKTMKDAYFKRLFSGKFFNAGQTCVAPDYLFIPKGWEQKIGTQLKQYLERYYPNYPNTNDYSCLISTDHETRLKEMLEDAKQKGARLEELPPSTQNKKMPLTLAFDVSNDMQLMQEEIFGPILPIKTYDKFEDVIEYIKRQDNPLALYYFGEDKQEKALLEEQTLSGALTINDTIMHVAMDDLPFGGVGASGIGRYHSIEGFDTFSQLKPVFTQRRFSGFTFMYPPYGGLVRFFLKYIAGLKL